MPQKDKEKKIMMCVQKIKMKSKNGEQRDTQKGARKKFCSHQYLYISV